MQDVQRIHSQRDHAAVKPVCEENAMASVFEHDCPRVRGECRRTEVPLSGNDVSAEAVSKLDRPVDRPVSMAGPVVSDPTARDA